MVIGTMVFSQPYQIINMVPDTNIKSMKLNCVIVDDDLFSLTIIEELARKSGLLNVLKTFTSSQEALAWLIKNPVDLLFLDMEMPDLTGFELLRLLQNKPDVIISSGSASYAMESFEFVVSDYLMKPPEYGKFLASVQKVLVKRNRRIVSEIESIFVKVDSLLIKIDINDILWIEASGDYVKIQTTDKLHTVYSTLINMYTKLPRKKFVRVHRSFIVNVSWINNIDPNNLEVDKKIIPVSANYKENLLSRINIL